MVIHPQENNIIDSFGQMEETDPDLSLTNGSRPHAKVRSLRSVLANALIVIILVTGSGLTSSKVRQGCG